MKDKVTTLKLSSWIWFKETCQWHWAPNLSEIDNHMFQLFDIYKLWNQIDLFLLTKLEIFLFSYRYQTISSISTIARQDNIYIYIYIWLNTDKIPCYIWRQTESSKAYIHIKLKVISILYRIKQVKPNINLKIEMHSSCSQISSYFYKAIFVRIWC